MSLLTTALADQLRGVRLAFLSGLGWLTAIWLWFGGSVLSSLGDGCRPITSDSCVQLQSPTVHLIVVAANALGPGLSLAVLGIVATLLGGTANFVFASLLAFRLRQPEERPEEIDLLMGWATHSDLADHGALEAEWREARKIRGEGLTRLTTAPPLAAVVVAFGVRVSVLAFVAMPLVLASAIQGVVALGRSKKMYESIRTRSED